ncbi:MAG: C39 family peptidase [Chloroflexota bacterium]
MVVAGGVAVRQRAALIVVVCGIVALARPVPTAAASPTLAVPYVSQLTPVPGLGRAVAAYACGPASAAMVARYFDAPAPLARAEALLGGTALIGDGSEPWQVAGAIRALAPGLAADAASAPDTTAARSLLESELARRHPVVALVHPSWFATPIDHFVVVIGLDRARDRVLFHDRHTSPRHGLHIAAVMVAEKTPFWRGWSTGVPSGRRQCSVRPRRY